MCKGRNKEGMPLQMDCYLFWKKQTNNKTPILPSDHIQEPSPGSHLHFHRGWCSEQSLGQAVLMTQFDATSTEPNNLYHLQPGQQKGSFFIHLYWCHFLRLPSFLVRDFCKSDKQLSATRRHAINPKPWPLKSNHQKLHHQSGHFITISGHLANVSALPDFLFLALTGVQDSAIRLQSVWVYESTWL